MAALLPLGGPAIYPFLSTAVRVLPQVLRTVSTLATEPSRFPAPQVQNWTHNEKSAVSLPVALHEGYPVSRHRCLCPKLSEPRLLATLVALWENAPPNWFAAEKMYQCVFLFARLVR
jgi:hypothetical protein